MRYGIGVDIGATNLRVAIARRDGVIIKKLSEKTVKGGDNLALPNQIIGMIERLLHETGLDLEEICGIGIGSIGPLDIRKGIIIKPANLPFENVPLVEPLEDRFHIRVTLLNDCTSAVVGEKYYGSGKNVENLVYVTISTGIGGGVYVDGHLLLGKDGNAHEIGHLVVDPEGRLLCGCGSKGHWEAYCSGSGIPRFARLLIEEHYKEQYHKSLLGEMSGYNLDAIDAKMVYDAAKVYDNLAIKIVERINFYNAIGFADVINVYDPSLITVGGSVALHNSEIILPYVLNKTPKYVINKMPEIKITTLGDEIVLLGAIAASFKGLDL
ncbi:MAG: ROK family protein [Thermoproteales archaeon]|nr:ROK family protein [Thermoproteales archaeon]